MNSSNDTKPSESKMDSSTRKKALLNNLKQTEAMLQESQSPDIIKMHADTNSAIGALIVDHHLKDRDRSTSSGITKDNLNELEQAFDYLKKAIEWRTKIQTPHSDITKISALFYTFAAWFIEQEQYNKLEEYFLKMIPLINKTDCEQLKQFFDTTNKRNFLITYWFKKLLDDKQITATNLFIKFYATIYMVTKQKTQAVNDWLKLINDIIDQKPKNILPFLETTHTLAKYILEINQSPEAIEAAIALMTKLDAILTSNGGPDFAPSSESKEAKSSPKFGKCIHLSFSRILDEHMSRLLELYFLKIERDRSFFPEVESVIKNLLDKISNKNKKTLLQIRFEVFQKFHQMDKAKKLEERAKKIEEEEKKKAIELKKEADRIEKNLKETTAINEIMNQFQALQERIRNLNDNSVATRIGAIQKELKSPSENRDINKLRELYQTWESKIKDWEDKSALLRSQMGAGYELKQQQDKQKLAKRVRKGATKKAPLNTKKNKSPAMLSEAQKAQYREQRAASALLTHSLVGKKTQGQSQPIKSEPSARGPGLGAGTN